MISISAEEERAREGLVTETLRKSEILNVSCPS